MKYHCTGGLAFGAQRVEFRKLTVEFFVASV